jgi:hypothetical protein
MKILLKLKKRNPRVPACFVPHGMALEDEVPDFGDPQIGLDGYRRVCKIEKSGITMPIRWSLSSFSTYTDTYNFSLMSYMNTG